MIEGKSRIYLFMLTNITCAPTHFKDMKMALPHELSATQYLPVHVLLKRLRQTLHAYLCPVYSASAFSHRDTYCMMTMWKREGVELGNAVNLFLPCMCQPNQSCNGKGAQSDFKSQYYSNPVRIVVPSSTPLRGEFLPHCHRTISNADPTLSNEVYGMGSGVLMLFVSLAAKCK